MAIVHRTIDPRTRTMPGWSTSCFHRPGRWRLPCIAANVFFFCYLDKYVHAKFGIGVNNVGLCHLSLLVVGAACSEYSGQQNEKQFMACCEWKIVKFKSYNIIDDIKIWQDIVQPGEIRSMLTRNVSTPKQVGQAS